MGGSTGGSWAGGSGGTFAGGTGGSFTGGSGGSGTGGTGGTAMPAMVGSDNCATAPRFTIDNPGRRELRAPLNGATKDLDPPCAVGSGGPDVYFRFNLNRRTLVYADTFGSSANTMLFFTETCTGGALAMNDQACSDDACGTMQSQVVATLPIGSYYLVVSGKAGTTGDITVNFETAPVSDRLLAPLPAGPSTLTGTTTGEGNIYVCEAAGAEASYWWMTCPSFPGGDMMSTTCTGTAFDTVLSLQVPRAGGAACNNDSCAFQSTLNTKVPSGGGLNVLSVAGSTLTQKGPFTLQVNRP